MKQQKINRGTHPPLFDRIVNDPKSENFGDQLFNADELKASIINELSIILNTRCTVRKVIYEDHLEEIPFFGSLDFFGLGDFSYFDGSNLQEWPKIARFIETAIRSAEPRLTHIHVHVESYDNISLTLHVNVQASVKERQWLKEIRFPLVLHNIQSTAKKTAA
ncbi:MAG: type VI secretion system baseplate subunit TssE [Alphaproteobacteria bacterium]|nr:type VI secretion system baseplate subunit TssE [Alphaproteobacteria bacterium]